jgi:hypothetical protein
MLSLSKHLTISTISLGGAMHFEIEMFRYVVMSSFEDLAEFRDMVEAQMQEAKQLDRDRIITQFKLFTPANRDEEEQIFAEQNTELEILDRKFAATYPRICRYSFLTMLFMHVETNLKAVCGEIAKRRKLDNRFGKGNAKEFLKKAQEFLTREAGLTSGSGIAWDQVNNLRIIRNCCVHDHGRVVDSPDKAEIEKLTKQDLGLSITPPTFPGVTEDDLSLDPDQGFLQIEPAFCISILEAVKSLFAEIFEKAGCFGPDHLVRVD